MKIPVELPALLGVLVLVYGFSGLEFVFDKAVVDFLAGHARGFKSARIFEQRRRSRHDLARTARCEHHVGKLALWSFGLHRQFDLSPSRPLGGRPESAGRSANV